MVRRLILLILTALWSCTSAMAFQAPSQALSDATSGMLPDNLSALVGRKVVVGRLALCVPNTFQPNLSYAGQEATVLSFTPNQAFNAININRLPSAARDMIASMKKGGLLLLQFGDGTKLDTCAAQQPAQLSLFLQVAPGQSIPAAPPPSPPDTSPAEPPVAANPICPLTITKVSTGNGFGHALVDTLTTSEFQRQLDATAHGGMGKHYLDVQVHNGSSEGVKAFEFVAVYSDRMGDASSSATFISQNTEVIKSNASYKASAMDRAELIQNGIGEVTVYISRVRFESDSTWLDNGSRSCQLKAQVRL